MHKRLKKEEEENTQFIPTTIGTFCVYSCMKPGELNFSCFHSKTPTLLPFDEPAKQKMLHNGDFL